MMKQTQTPILAWWFSAGDRLPNGDNRKIVVGETLTVPGPLELCNHGLHGSIRCLDALEYAIGTWLHRVRHSGIILVGYDKLCSTERTVLARFDVTNMLGSFARSCASDVSHLWNAPAVVLEYLSTGDESLRSAARNAAADAAADAGAYAAAARAAARAAAAYDAYAAADARAAAAADAAADAGAYAAGADAREADDAAAGAYATAYDAARSKQANYLEQLALNLVKLDQEASK